MISAIVPCVSVVRFVFFERETIQLVLTIVYILCILLEIFPICYFGNLLMEHTKRLTFAIYDCNWVEQDHTFRKSVIIFMERSQRTSIILAGNMIPISLLTFASVRHFKILHIPLSLYLTDIAVFVFFVRIIESITEPNLNYLNFPTSTVSYLLLIAYFKNGVFWGNESSC